MGAALVASISDRHDPRLLRLLVALQVAWDYIDTLAEQPGGDAIAAGRQLHRALTDAVSAGPLLGDYYRLHPSQDDGGYLAALVGACRDACVSLPAYEPVRAFVAQEIAAAEIQYVNHAPAAERDAILRRWAAGHGDRAETGWIELAAAASSSLGVLAMLTLAIDPRVDAAAAERLRAAYVPWVDALTALLDSLVDQAHDATTGLMNFIRQYPSEAAAGQRVSGVTARALGAVRELPHGARHVVVVTGMIAMHLSKASAWEPEAEPISRRVLQTTDTPVMPLLLLLLRAWRFVRSSRRARSALRPDGAGAPTAIQL